VRDEEAKSGCDSASVAREFSTPNSRLRAAANPPRPTCSPAFIQLPARKPLCGEIDPLVPTQAVWISGLGEARGAGRVTAKSGSRTGLRHNRGWRRARGGEDQGGCPGPEEKPLPRVSIRRSGTGCSTMGQLSKPGRYAARRRRGEGTGLPNSAARRKSDDGAERVGAAGAKGEHTDSRAHPERPRGKWTLSAPNTDRHRLSTRGSEIGKAEGFFVFDRIGVKRVVGANGQTRCLCRGGWEIRRRERG